METKGKNFERGLAMAKRYYVSHRRKQLEGMPLVSPKMVPSEGSRIHVATDGSLLGVSSKSSACGRSVVQLDHDEEVGPMHGMHSTLDAELEVQRTIERAQLTVCLCLIRRISGPTKAHVDNKGIIDGLWR